jgi:molybdenum cofactor cytidylyltransferase
VPVSGIILAAGESRRLGRPKQLLDVFSRPLLQVVVDNAAASHLDDVVVVLGAHRDLIRQSVDFHRARLVQNERFAEGQSTSVVAALEAINPEVSAVLFLLGDQPGVTPDVIDAVLDAFDGSTNSIVMPSWQGIPANPVLFGSGFFDELYALRGDEGARPVVKRHPDCVHLVEVDRPVPPDIDTEVDYAQLLATPQPPSTR